LPTGFLPESGERIIDVDIGSYNSRSLYGIAAFEAMFSA
jgi:CTP:phosphocholine cytidylyltransferase-like protein